MPTPTDAQIEATREVLELDSFEQTRELILGLNEAQWAAQLADNVRWTKLVGTGKPKVKRLDKIEFFSKSESDGHTLADIRKSSRLRFGLPSPSGIGIFPTTLRYF